MSSIMSVGEVCSEIYHVKTRSRWLAFFWYLNDVEVNKISQSGLAHSLYSNLMKRAINQDSLIIKEIDIELTK